jgi:hypothetical protein
VQGRGWIRFDEMSKQELISTDDDPLAGCDDGFGALLWRHKEGGKAQEKEGKKEGGEGPSARWRKMEEDGQKDGQQEQQQQQEKAGGGINDRRGDGQCGAWILPVNVRIVQQKQHPRQHLKRCSSSSNSNSKGRHTLAAQLMQCSGGLLSREVTRRCGVWRHAVWTTGLAGYIPPPPPRRLVLPCAK